MAFFGITVNFMNQKLKSKHLVCLSFSGERLNLRGLRESILQKVWALGTLPAEMFGGSDFWLETRVIIKMSTHPCQPINFDLFSKE